ncbi:hypothetical protein R6Q59_008777 [Mikania micrantha]
MYLFERSLGYKTHVQDKISIESKLEVKGKKRDIGTNHTPTTPPPSLLLPDDHTSSFARVYDQNPHHHPCSPSPSTSFFCTSSGRSLEPAIINNSSIVEKKLLHQPYAPNLTVKPFNSCFTSSCMCLTVFIISKIIYSM